MDNSQRQRLHAALVQLADGDRSVFAALFDELWPIVRRFVQHAVLHAADAEDLAQITMLKVFSRISEFDTSRDGVAWVLGIAAYEVRTLRRQRQRRREVAADDLIGEFMARGDASDERLIIQDLHLALDEALGTLSPVDRAALLADSRGPGADGGSPTAWRKRRQRALERLRKAWRHVHG